MTRRPTWIFAPLEIPSQIDGERYAIRASVAMGLFLAAQIAAAILYYGLNDYGLQENVAGLFMQVIWFFGTLAYIGVPLWKQRDRWIDLLGGTVDTGKRMLFGMSGFFADAPLLALTLLIMIPISPYLPAPTHPLTQEVSAGGTTTMIISFLSATILAPLIEETIFRGLILRALLGLFGRPWPAIILQGFLFAAIHPQGPAGWLPLMVLGCMCGWLTYRSGSIVPAIFLHFVHNGFIVMMLTFVF